MVNVQVRQAVVLHKRLAGHVPKADGAILENLVLAAMEQVAIMVEPAEAAFMVAVLEQEAVAMAAEAAVQDI